MAPQCACCWHGRLNASERRPGQLSRGPRDDWVACSGTAARAPGRAYVSCRRRGRAWSAVRSMSVETGLVVACRPLLGESIVWGADAGELVWVDIHDGEVWRYRVAEQTIRAHVLPDRVGALGLCDDGTYVVALASGFARFDPSSEHVRR